MGEVCKLVARQVAVRLENRIDNNLLVSRDCKRITIYIACDDGTPSPVRASNFEHNGAMLPCAYFFGKERSILGYQTPCLTVIQQLLQLETAKPSLLIQNVGRNIDCPAHIDPLSDI